MAPVPPSRPPPPGSKPPGADVRDIDYEDDLPTGVAPRQPSSPDLARPPRKGSARIDPRDVFYLTDRALPSLTDETIRTARSPAPSQPVRGPVPPLTPPPVSPSALPRVRMPDPRVTTVAFPLSSRRTSRPPAGEQQAPAAAPNPPPPAAGFPAPAAPAAPRHKFPPLPELRTVRLDPPVEARWTSAGLVFAVGLAVLLLSAIVFAFVVGFYGP